MNHSEASKKIREALGTQEPRLHHIPRWMLRRLVKSFPSQCRTQDEAKRKIFHLASGFLDHFGTIKQNGKLIFVCEPYGPSSGQLMLAEAFAEVLKIRCSADPESWWYPGKTYRISFWESEDD